MKRILSLTLAAVMLLSVFALTSCNQVNDVVHQIFTGEARTTVTEDEWNKTASIDNYTLAIKSKYENIEFMRMGSLAKITQFASEYTVSAVIDVENHLFYYNSSVGYFNVCIGDEFDYDLSEYGLETWLSDVEYADLSYQELTKSYNAKIGSTIMDIYFENGVLSHAIIMNTNNPSESIEIKNVGKTVLERPETFAKFNDGKVEPSDAGKIVRTQITEKEWQAVEEMNNCTVNVVSIQSNFPYETTIKLTEEARVESNSYFNYMINETTKVAIDGYYFTLEKDEFGQYVAQKTDEEAKGILNTVIDVDAVSFADLVYNEQGRFYSITLGDTVLCFYFENGKLVKLDAFLGSAENEIVVFISDIGTTTIEVPEYTIVEYEI